MNRLLPARFSLPRLPGRPAVPPRSASMPSDRKTHLHRAGAGDQELLCVVHDGRPPTTWSIASIFYIFREPLPLETRPITSGLFAFLNLGRAAVEKRLPAAARSEIYYKEGGIAAFRIFERKRAEGESLRFLLQKKLHPLFTLSFCDRRRCVMVVANREFQMRYAVRVAGTVRANGKRVAPATTFASAHPSGQPFLLPNFRRAGYLPCARYAPFDPCGRRGRNPRRGDRSQSGSEVLACQSRLSTTWRPGKPAV